ncbi:MAG TPA: mechanosensitive ion channel family protein [Candidatus Acidoferrales bacterium]|jgi:small conductance mechanosensitive channel|nr:mechanosensitive ion channel family protein [Candidatus Acidoferrales bacterium]
MIQSPTRWVELVWTRGLRLAAILILAFLAVRLWKALTSRLVEISKARTRGAQMREQQTRTMAGLLYSVGVAVILIGAILTALPELGFNVTPVEAAAAVASLALGFGAQNLVRDLINGFFIVFEDQFVVGDLIQANGETGRVEYLTIRRTVLRNAGGAVVTIPNGQLGQLANLSRDWSQLFVDVTVPSDESVNRALVTLEKVGADFRNDKEWSPALVDGPRVLGVESLSLDGTVIRLQVRTILNRKEEVGRELRRRVKMAFEEQQIPLSHTHKVEFHGPAPEPAQ